MIIYFQFIKIKDELDSVNLKYYSLEAKYEDEVKILKYQLQEAQKSATIAAENLANFQPIIK